MSEKKKIIILGAGGTFIDILDALHEINSIKGKMQYECVGFLDDDKKKLHKVINGVKVLGPLERVKDFTDVYFINGIGNVDNFLEKKALLAKLKIQQKKFITIIHPSASVSKMATVGTGCVILQNTTIAANAKIGNHVVILANSLVSHDVVIGDYTFITGGVCISGGVTVFESCYLGTNSTVHGNIQIGKKSLVGMGSVVLKDVPLQSVVVGNPARFLRKIK